MVKPQKPHTDKSHKSHKARLENKKTKNIALHGNFDIILLLWTIQVSLKFHTGWEFWCHLTLMDISKSVWSSMEVGILISPCPFAHSPSIWSSLGVRILKSPYLCGHSVSIEVPWRWEFWYHLTLADNPSQFDVLWWISSCPCAQSLHGGGTFEIIFEFWYHLTLVDSRSVSISSSMGVTIVWGNFSCTVAQSGDRSCASRVVQA